MKLFSSLHGLWMESFVREWKKGRKKLIFHLRSEARVSEFSGGFWVVFRRYFAVFFDVIWRFECFWVFWVLFVVYEWFLGGFWVFSSVHRASSVWIYGGTNVCMSCVKNMYEFRWGVWMIMHSDRHTCAFFQSARYRMVDDVYRSRVHALGLTCWYSQGESSMKKLHLLGG